jgi:hypothetical protein
MRALAHFSLLNMGMIVSSQNGLFQHVSNVYLRGDNVSTRIERKATVGEIEWLLNKRQRSFELKQRLLANANERTEKIHLQRRERIRLRSYSRNS